MVEQTLNLYWKKFIMVQEIFKKAAFIFISVVLLSCSESPEKRELSFEEELFNKRLEDFQAIFPELRRYDWEIHSAYENEKKTELELELDGKRGDTSVVAALNKITYTENYNLVCEYSISRFIKIYDNDGMTHKIYSIGGREILYHYYYPGELDDPNKRIFLEGKYRYLYISGALDSLGARYYLHNMDSLDKIKGDYPKL